MSKIFTPHELKTIEVDVENNIFRINGEDFGEDCTGFAIYCNGHRDFEIRVEVETKVVLATYGKDLQKNSEKEYQTNSPWFSARAKNELSKNGN